MNKHLYSPHQRMVHEFHAQFGIYTGEWPHLPPEYIKNIRIDLLLEELEELRVASANGDIVGVADALGDLEFLVNGTALAWGIALEPIFQEVYRSNMTKAGGQKSQEPKVIKGSNFSPPDLEPLLEAQIPGEGAMFTTL